MSEYQRTTTENDRVVFEKGESDDRLDSLMLCNEAIMWSVQNGFKRTKPLMFKTLGENVLHNKIHDEKARSRYTKKRRR